MFFKKEHEKLLENAEHKANFAEQASAYYKEKIKENNQMLESIYGRLKTVRAEIMALGEKMPKPEGEIVEEACLLLTEARGVLVGRGVDENTNLLIHGIDNFLSKNTTMRR